jgi:nucleoside-diphosphate-sugar epimerase
MAATATARTVPLAGTRLWVAGHRGMVGQALLRRLARADCTLLTVPRGPRVAYRRSLKNARSNAAARRSPMPP